MELGQWPLYWTRGMNIRWESFKPPTRLEYSKWFCLFMGHVEVTGRAERGVRVNQAFICRKSKPPITLHVKRNTANWIVWSYVVKTLRCSTQKKKKTCSDLQHKTCLEQNLKRSQPTTYLFALKQILLDKLQIKHKMLKKTDRAKYTHTYV